MYETGLSVFFLNIITPGFPNITKKPYVTKTSLPWMCSVTVKILVRSVVGGCSSCYSLIYLLNPSKITYDDYKLGRYLYSLIDNIATCKSIKIMPRYNNVYYR